MLLTLVFGSLAAALLRLRLLRSDATSEIVGEVGMYKKKKELVLGEEWERGGRGGRRLLPVSHPTPIVTPT